MPLRHESSMRGSCAWLWFAIVALSVAGLATFLWMLGGAAGTWSESTRLSGAVLDTGGAPIPGARVTLVRRTNATFEGLPPGASDDAVELGHALSDERGRFGFEVSRAVPHELRASAPGFAPHTRRACYGEQDVELRLGPGATIQGQVRFAPDQTPVPGARMFLFQDLTYDRRAEVVSDVDGRFAFADIDAGDWVLSACTERGAAPLRTRLRLVAGARVEHDVLIDPGDTVAGRVIDAATGEPVVGARLHTARDLGRWTDTDGEGRFTLLGFPDRNNQFLFVRAAGYVESWIDTLQVAPEERHREVDIELVRSGAIAGRVTDSRGRPLPEIEIRIGSVTSFYRDTPAQRTVRTDADGRFRVHDLASGIQVLEALVPSDARQLEVKLARSERRHGVDFVAELGLGITGQVSWAGEVPFDVAVDLTPKGGARDAGRRTFMRADGSFASFGLRAGSYRLVATPLDGEYAELVLDVDAGTSGLTLQLPAGATIRGRVVDARGDPIFNATVFVADDTRIALTDTEGRFEVVVEPDAKVDLQVRVPRIAEWGWRDAELLAPEDARAVSAPREGLVLGVRD